MRKSTKIVTLLVLALVIIISAYVLIKKQANAPTTSGETASTASNNPSVTNGENGPTSGVAEINTGNGETSTVHIIDKNVLAKIPKPSLDRPIAINDQSMDAATKTQVTNAIKQTIAGIKAEPTALDKWTQLGVLFKIIGDYQGAREMWEYVSRANPYDVASFSNLADLYMSYLKDYPKAESNFLQVIKNDPAYVTGYLNLANLYHYYYQKDTNKAEDTLRAGIAKNKGAIDLYTTLARYYKEKGDKINALIYYNQALPLIEQTKNEMVAESIKAEIANLREDSP